MTLVPFLTIIMLAIRKGVGPLRTHLEPTAVGGFCLEADVYWRCELDSTGGFLLSQNDPERLTPPYGNEYNRCASATVAGTQA